MQEVECACPTLPLPVSFAVTCWCDGFRGVLLTQEVYLSPYSRKSPTLVTSHFDVNFMGITVEMSCVVLLGRWWLWEQEGPAVIHGTCPAPCLQLRCWVSRLSIK